MVEVKRYGDGGGVGGVGAEVGEVRGVEEGPGEEEEHCGGGLGFSGADGRDDAFEIVLEVLKGEGEKMG